MIHIFTCSWYWCWKILFLWGFYVELKSLIKIFNFSHFRNIFGSCRSQMFFKITVLKNFAIFWIIKSLQHWCFLVSIVNFLRTAFLENFSDGCFCILLKVIKRFFNTTDHGPPPLTTSHRPLTHLLKTENRRPESNMFCLHSIIPGKFNYLLFSWKCYCLFIFCYFWIIIY